MFFKPSVVLVLVDTLKNQFGKAPRLTTGEGGTTALAINAAKVTSAQIADLNIAALHAGDFIDAVVDRSGYGVRLTITVAETK